MSNVPSPPNNLPPSSPPPPPPPPSGLTPPPGYAGYDTTPGPAGGSRRIGALATSVVVSTVVAAGASIVTTVLSAGITDDAVSFLRDEISQQDFEDAFAPLGAMQTLSFLATLVTGILTIIWMFRIASNIRAFGRATTWAPLFAIFGWLLPPLLYLIPFLMLRELWKASEPTATGDGDAWRKRPDNRVLWVWFVGYGVVPLTIFVTQAGSLFGTMPDDFESVAEGLDDFSATLWVGAAATLFAGVAWVVFVRQLTARHKQLTNET